MQSLIIICQILVVKPVWKKIGRCIEGCVAWGGGSYVISSRATGWFPFGAKIPDAKQFKPGREFWVFITLT